jgi:hypothetical protein
MDWEPVIWTLLLLGPLLWLVREAHQQLQELFFLVTGHQAMTIYLFQVLLLPGVILHEVSHYLVAKLLGVRVRKISLRPDIKGQKVQMGAVVMDRPDFIRGLLIGLAPMVLGTAMIVLIGRHVFEVERVIAAARESQGQEMIQAVRAAFEVQDAWIWFYLLFAISNAMLPSEADREGLRPTMILVTLVLGLVILTGYGPDLLSRLAAPLEMIFGLLLAAFGMTLFVDLIFVGIIILLKIVISLLTGRRVERTA